MTLVAVIGSLALWRQEFIRSGERF